jgi:hypothetical protein
MNEEITLTGSLNWKQLKDHIIKALQEATTEEEVLKVIEAILFACSNSEEEMQEKRRDLGIPET